MIKHEKFPFLHTSITGTDMDLSAALWNNGKRVSVQQLSGYLCNLGELTGLYMFFCLCKCVIWLEQGEHKVNVNSNYIIGILLGGGRKLMGNSCRHGNKNYRNSTQTGTFLCMQFMATRTHFLMAVLFWVLRFAVIACFVKHTTTLWNTYCLNAIAWVLRTDKDVHNCFYFFYAYIM